MRKKNYHVQWINTIRVHPVQHPIYAQNQQHPILDWLWFIWNSYKICKIANKSEDCMLAVNECIWSITFYSRILFILLKVHMRVNECEGQMDLQHIFFLSSWTANLFNVQRIEDFFDINSEKNCCLCPHGTRVKICQGIRKEKESNYHFWFSSLHCTST